MLVITYGKIDTWFSRRLYPFIQWALRVTGKDNFYFVWRLYWTSAILMVCHYSIAFTTKRSSFLTAAVALIWIWIFHTKKRDIRLVEAAVSRSQESTMSFSVQEWAAIRSICLDRCFGTLLIIVYEISYLLIRTTPSVFDLSFGMLCLSGYFTTHVCPPGQSVWARAKLKIKSLRLPKLLPAPLPA